MKYRKSLVVVVIAVLLTLAVRFSHCDQLASRHISGSVSRDFPEVVEHHRNSEWRLFFADGVGGLHEIDLLGTTHQVFTIANRFTQVGYNKQVNRFVIFEELYTDLHITVPDVPHEVTMYKLLMHDLDFSGKIVNTVKIPRLQRGIGHAVFPPSGRYALVTANFRQHVTKSRGIDDYDYFYLDDVFLIDTATGVARLLLQGSCRDLGEIHPNEDEFLFTNKDGIICRFSLLDNSTTPLFWGSRPYWSSNASAVRYVKALHWTVHKGDTSYSKLTGDESIEYEYGLKTKKERKLGPAGRDFIWSPNREYGMRFFHFDSLFKGVNRARVIMEKSNAQVGCLITKEMRYPWSPLWVAPVRPPTKTMRNENR